MHLLKQIDVHTAVYDGPLDIKEWVTGDPFPPLGPSVGVDTETELITDCVLDPPVVVAGVFDPAHYACWIIFWQHIPAFMRELNSMAVEQRYFNLGFDEQVLNNEDDTKSLLTAIEAGRVRDMQVRVHLNEIATIGFVRGNMFSLAGCAKHILGLELDKGDPANYEHSARMTFRRYNQDGTAYKLTDAQIEYLPYDCIATWGLGERVPEQPTEIQHTKGMVVLAHISTNGLSVDPVVFDHLEASLIHNRDTYRLDLLSFGFPDPYKDVVSESIKHKVKLVEQYSIFCYNHGITPDIPSEDKDGVSIPIMPKRKQFRLALSYMYNWDKESEHINDIAESVRWALQNEKASYGKRAQEIYLELCEKMELLAFDKSKREIVMPAFMGALLENLNMQYASGKAKETGYDIEDAVQKAADYMDQHPEWLTADKQIGPRKFFQSYVADMLARYPKLELEKTPKSGDIKLTLKDMWRLEDCGIEDRFLEAFTNFNHCQKYVSTYLNRAFIKSDGKVHPKFTNILRTGRTSCSAPNVQNLPSRDKVYPLKNMYKPYDGMILCATDFSFIELCAFAQTCYSRFGFSVMRDVINAGLDPHRWFAGVMEKIITPDLTHKDDPVWVNETKQFLKDNVPDALRQKAKAANFG